MSESGYCIRACPLALSPLSKGGSGNGGTGNGGTVRRLRRSWSCDKNALFHARPENNLIAERRRACWLAKLKFKIKFKFKFKLFSSKRGMWPPVARGANVPTPQHRPHARDARWCPRCGAAPSRPMARRISHHRRCQRRPRSRANCRRGRLFHEFGRRQDIGNGQQDPVCAHGHHACLLGAGHDGRPRRTLSQAHSGIFDLIVECRATTRSSCPLPSASYRLCTRVCPRSNTSNRSIARWDSRCPQVRGAAAPRDADPGPAQGGLVEAAAVEAPW